jgi:glycosyltransferase involved in cell wall biosynthesis
MRILHVDTAREWRGGQNQVFLTARGMLARGHQVTLACRAAGILESRAREAGLAVRPLAFGRGDLSPTSVRGLAEALREVGPDVVQLHDPHGIAAGLMASRLVGYEGPVVATRRVDFHLRGVLSPLKYRACHRVVAVSRAIAEVLAADGVPAERIRLVYEGVPDRPPLPGGRETLGALGVPEGSPVVGNIAALTDHKDHGTLIQAARMVVDRLPQARVVVFGEGDLKESIASQVRELALGGHVILAGFRNDLDRLIPAFSVFCLSSHQEGLGTSLLDAMCFARPIVATCAGGIPEAVADGVNGRTVPVRDPQALAEALVTILADPAIQRRMGEAGRRRFLEHFTADRMVEETLDVYRELH